MIAAKVRQEAIKLFARFLDHPHIEIHLAKWLKRQQQSIASVTNLESPYYNYKPIAETSQRDDIIIITGRFRSGSTALWNLFRQSKGFTAYYEPFNERQWFNAMLRGEKVDKTHLGVTDYWKEYDGLDDLTSLYSENWTRSDLHMDADFWQPQMKSYIEKLIDHASERPVLQFNRIDFRLPWIRCNFPNSTIIHIYRNPRDQWLSFLTDKRLMNSRDVENTYIDAFYLNMWCNDLARFFPFLDQDQTPHPYQRFYYLWKLSYLYGKHYANISFSLEELTQNTTHILQLIEKSTSSDHELTLGKEVLKEPQLDKWKNYAAEEWFINHELACETTLRHFFEPRGREY